MAEEPMAPQTPFKRSADFVSRYANNIRFESFASDCKVIFGQSDLSSGNEVIEQHTAITTSWIQVKLAIYYLQVNLAMYEAQNGPVAIPSILMPAPFPEQPPPELQSDPNALRVLQRLREMRDSFVASLKT